VDMFCIVIINMVFNLTTPQKVDEYNSLIATANKYRPQALMIWCTTISFSSFIILFAIYLLYKTTKVYNKNFFILVNSLILVGAIGGCITTELLYQMFTEAAALPVLGVQ